MSDRLRRPGQPPAVPVRPDAPIHLQERRHPRAVVCGLELFAHDTGDPEKVTCDVCRAIHAGCVVLVAGRQATAVVLSQAEAASVVALGEALERIARTESSVPGLRPHLYGHAVDIAEKALAAVRPLLDRLRAAGDCQ